jgi:hypothetical protein
VLLCYQIIAQSHERLPIANDSISCFQHAGMEAMHYPYLVSTTCVSAGMIARGAVVGDWPGGSAPLQPCPHVLDGLPYPLVMHVSQRLECGSHAAAPAVLTIRRVAYRSPSWSRRSWMDRFDHRVGRACMRYLCVKVSLHQVRVCTPMATASPCRRWR